MQISNPTFNKFPLILSLVSLCGILSAPALAEAPNIQNEIKADLPLASQLDELEVKYGIKGNATVPVLERLAKIEIAAFGEQREGALFDRVKELKLAPNPSIQEKSPTPLLDPNLVRGKNEKMEDYLKRLNLQIPYINTQPPRLYRIKPVGTSPTNPELQESQDYLDIILKATKGRVLRFKEMPIPVYITPLRNNQYMKSCIAGFEAWESRTDGTIRFVQVTDPNKARIRVVWKQLGMGKDKNDCALGAHTVTKWKKRGNGKVAMMSVGAIPVPLYIPRFGPKYKVPPQIIEVNTDLIDSKRQDIKFFILQNIVTHELGHALGILGHSDFKSDMMYPVTDQHSRISDRDLNSLSKLYRLKVDIPL